jgi:hypothetical protein
MRCAGVGSGHDRAEWGWADVRTSGVGFFLRGMEASPLCVGVGAASDGTDACGVPLL